MNDSKLPYTFGCSIEQFQTLTKFPLNVFHPNPMFSWLFYLEGATVFLLEVLVSRVAGISPQPLFVAMFLVAIMDQSFGRGAIEKLLWTLFPQMLNRVLKHKVENLLVAHLLGCPVKLVALEVWYSLTEEQNGNGSELKGASTSFSNPNLNDSSRNERVTWSTVDCGFSSSSWLELPLKFFALEWSKVALMMRTLWWSFLSNCALCSLMLIFRNKQGGLTRMC